MKNQVLPVVIVLALLLMGAAAFVFLVGGDDMDLNPDNPSSSADAAGTGLANASAVDTTHRATNTAPVDQGGPAATHTQSGNPRTTTPSATAKGTETLQPVQPDVEFELAPLGSGEMTAWGKVVDEALQPVPNAALRVDQYFGTEPAGAATSDKNGKFHFNVPANNRYILRVSAKGYAPAELRPMPMNGGEISVTLKAANPLTGKVLEAGTGQPISSFTITFAEMAQKNMPSSPEFIEVHRARAEGRKDVNLLQTYEFHSPDGSYTIASLPREERLLMLVNAEGYLGDSAFISGQVENQPRIIRLESGETVTGVVVDKERGAPLRGVHVRLLDTDGNSEIPSQDLYTNDEGEFSLRVASSAKASWFRRVDFSLEGYGYVNMLERSLSKQSVNTIEMGPGGRVAVVVKDTEGAPMPGQVVRLTDAMEFSNLGNGVTDAAGRWISDLYAAQDLRVVVYFEEPATPNLTYAPPVVARQHKDVKITEGRDVDIEFVQIRGATLSGRFLVAGDLQQDAEVSAETSASWHAKDVTSTRTDAEGNYKLTHLKDGQYSLKMSSILGTVTRSLVIHEAGSQTATFDVPAIPVRVELQSGAPLTDKVRLTWRRIDPIGDWRYERDEWVPVEGKVTTLLPLGTYNVHVALQDRFYDLESIQVTDGQTVVLVVSDENMGAFTALDWDSGEKLDTFMGRFYPYNNGQQAGQDFRWGSQGLLYYEYDWDKFDEYRVVLSQSGYAPFGPIIVKRATFTKDMITARMEKGGGSIKGRVLTPAGTPPDQYTWVTIAYAELSGPFQWIGLDTNGYFSFDSLKAGHYRITVSAANYEIVVTEVSLGANEVRDDVDIPLTPK